MRVFVVLVALANLCASQPTDQSGLRGNVLEPGVSSFVSDSGMGSVPDAGMLQPGATDPAMDTFSDTGAFSDVVMGQPGASDFGMGAFPEAGMGQPDATGPGMGAFPDAGTGQPGVTDPFMDAFPDAGAFPDTGMGQPGASDFGMGAFSDSGNVQSGATDPGAGLVSESGMAATGTAGAGGEVPGKRQAGAAADLLRGLMGETSSFDAAATTGPAGATEGHEIVAGSPSKDTAVEQPSVSMPGLVPGATLAPGSASVVRTVTEEKSSVSMSGESSFETFSSVRTGGTPSDTAGSSQIDLNPVASDVGANILDADRGLRDFPIKAAAAKAADKTITDIGAAEVVKPAGGASTGTDISSSVADGSTTAVEGASVTDTSTGAADVGATGAVNVDMSAGGAMDIAGATKADIAGTVTNFGTIGVDVDVSAGGAMGGEGATLTDISRTATDFGAPGVGADMSAGGAVGGEGSIMTDTAGTAGDFGAAGVDVDISAGGAMGSEGATMTDTAGTAAVIRAPDGGVDMSAGGAMDAAGTAADFGAPGVGVDISAGDAMGAEGATMTDTSGTPADFGATGVDMPAGDARGAANFGASEVGIDISARGAIGEGSIMKDTLGTATDFGARGVDVDMSAGGTMGAEGATITDTSGTAADFGSPGVGVDMSTGGTMGAEGAPLTDISGTAADFGAPGVGVDMSAGSTMGAEGATMTDTSGTAADFGSSGVVVDMSTGGTMGAEGATLTDTSGTAADFGAPGVGVDMSAGGAIGEGSIMTDTSGTAADFGAPGVGVDMSAGGAVGDGSIMKDTSRTATDFGAPGVDVDMSAGGTMGVEGATITDTSGTVADFGAPGVGVDMSAGGAVGDGSIMKDTSRTATDFGAPGVDVDMSAGGTMGVEGATMTDTSGTAADFGSPGVGVDMSAGGAKDGEGAIMTDTSGTAADLGAAGVISTDKSSKGSFDFSASREMGLSVDATATGTTREHPGAPGLGQSFPDSSTGQAQGGTKDISANVLDSSRGIRDFATDVTVTHTVDETGAKPSGSAGGIFDWSGNAGRERSRLRESTIRGTTMTGDMRGGKSGSVVGGVDMSREGSLTAEGSLSVDKSMGGSVSGVVDMTRKGSLTAEGSLSIDKTMGGSVTGGVDMSKKGSLTAEGSLTVDKSMGGPGTGGVDMTREGSMVVDRSKEMSVTGDARWDISGSVVGGVDMRREGSLSIDRSVSLQGQGGVSMAGGRGTDQMFRDKGRQTAGGAAARASLEERTVRQGEWSATWNYEGSMPEWFRSRVDPAPCRKYGCNLASCYVPNPNDCKSYIVCQRTALGNYVATRMRCAFGSYWTNSNIWTCERITDIKEEKFNCPNDPCRDPTLSRYPDEDFDNCRSYWNCIDGRSEPVCCPPGQRFDRDLLTCVNDPTESCREPCPLKQHGCVVAGAKKQPYFDGNCRTYWDCGPDGAPHPVCCPPGQSFDPTQERCVESGCNQECPTSYTADVCGKMSANGVVVKSFKSKNDTNCRTYMKCEPNGGKVAACCRSEYFYNRETMECERVTDLLDICREETCPDGFQEDCRYMTVPDPRQMYDIDAGFVRDCADGTVFDISICTCDFAPEPFRRDFPVCRKEVHMKFDNPKERWNVKNYGDGFISVFGDMTKNITTAGNHFGTFDGRSGLEIWRYDHNVLPEVTLKVTFQPVAVPNGEKQILASNCQTTTSNGEPSFEVALNPATSMITFTGRTKTEMAVVELRYNTNKWNTYTLLFDGEDVLALIEDPNALGKADSSSTKLKGELLRGMGPLIFGPCKDKTSKPKRNGFIGFISEAIFAKCLDEESRNFMSDTLATSLRTGPI